jgi:hypothetical protein
MCAASRTCVRQGYTYHLITVSPSYIYPFIPFHFHHWVIINIVSLHEGYFSSESFTLTSTSNIGSGHVTITQPTIHDAMFTSSSSSSSAAVVGHLNAGDVITIAWEITHGTAPYIHIDLRTCPESYLANPPSASLCSRLLISPSILDTQYVCCYIIAPPSFHRIRSCSLLR